MPLIKQYNYLVSCVDTPNAPLKHWFVGFSGIFHQCVCGKTCAFAGDGYHENYKKHLKVYKVYLKMVGDWDTYLDTVLETVEHDRERYLIDWEEVK